MQLRKLVSLVFEGGVILEGLIVEVEYGVFEKFMFLILVYGIVLIDVGRIQYVFLFVIVSEFFCLYFVLMVYSNEVIWEQFFLRLVM